MTILSASEMDPITHYPPIDTSLLVHAKLFIGGKKVEYRTLSLQQAYGEHHFFEIEIPFNLLNPPSFYSNATDVFNLSGKTVNISFMHGKDQIRAYDFIGFVTGTEVIGEDGKGDYTIIRGMSKTGLLDTGRRFAVYSDFALSGIIDDVTYGCDGNFGNEIVTELMRDKTVDITVQYNESNWEFLQRICYQHGENLFYSGEELLIGKGKEWDKNELMYGADLSKLSFGTQLVPGQYEYIGYNPKIHEQFNSETAQASAPFENDYLNQAFENNKKLVSEYPSRLYSPYPTENAAELDEQIKTTQERIGGKTVCVKGVSKSLGATIGRTIIISLPEGGALGVFKVIACKHIIDQNIHYRNEFTAIPDALSVIPAAQPRIPIASTLRAEVTSTADPLNQGRVQVKFPFQVDTCKAWLRVMTPDGGFTEENKPNRGLVFIPEKGSQVLVDFEMGNPDYPYVAGALFHGKNGQGGYEDNHIKTITTRSGLTIKFDDSKDSLGISLYDKEKNLLHLNTKENRIELFANEEIVLEAKKITLNAAEKLQLTGQEIAEHSKEHEIVTEGTFKAEANSVTLRANALTQTSTGKAEIISGSSVEIKGSAISMDTGGNAQSPQAPAEARNMIAFPETIPPGMLESEILPEEENSVEPPGEEPQILSIKLLDKDGVETEYLSRSTRVEVETRDMAGKKIELKLQDNETGEIVWLGDYLIPTNEYILKTMVRKAERHIVNE